jgi:hypothetical protein
MTCFRFILLLTLGCLFGTFTSPLKAAPDNALGMALLGAFVNYDGTLYEGSGVTSAPGHPGVGNYDITFDRDISRCFISITPYTSNVVPGFFRNPGSSVVRVYLNSNTGGAAVDTTFSMLIFCAK